MDLTISKDAVMNQVAQITAYAGAKSGKYDQIATVDQDESLLKTFWQDCIDTVALSLRKVLVRVESSLSTITFILSDLGHKPLIPTLCSRLAEYFALRIVARWYEFVKRDEAADYKAVAATMLDDICRSLLLKRTKRKISKI